MMNYAYGPNQQGNMVRVMSRAPYGTYISANLGLAQDCCGLVALLIVALVQDTHAKAIICPFKCMLDLSVDS